MYIGSFPPAWPTRTLPRSPEEQLHAQAFLAELEALCARYRFRLEDGDYGEGLNLLQLDRPIQEHDGTLSDDVLGSIELRKEGLLLTLRDRMEPLPESEGRPLYEERRRHWEAFLDREAASFLKTES